MVSLQIDFGCVQHSRIHERELVIENVSDLDAHYHWSLAKGAGTSPGMRLVLGASRHPCCRGYSGGGPACVGYPAHQRATRARAEGTCRADLRRYARCLSTVPRHLSRQRRSRLSGKASRFLSTCVLRRVCQVPLVAQSGETRFDVTPREIDFGPCRYGTTAQQKLTVRNTGAVPFRFDVVLDRLQFASLVHCAPTTGHLSPHAETTVQLWMNIAVPGHLYETLEIKIENGGGVEVTLHAECLCSVLTTSLPSTAQSDADTSMCALDTYREDIADQIRQTTDDALSSTTVTDPVAFAKRHVRRCRALRTESGLLDYGILTKGDIASQSFTLTNAGPLPVTHANRTRSATTVAIGAVYDGEDLTGRDLVCAATSQRLTDSSRRVLLRYTGHERLGRWRQDLRRRTAARRSQIAVRCYSFPCGSGRASTAAVGKRARF